MLNQCIILLNSVICLLVLLKFKRAILIQFNYKKYDDMFNLE